jgi:hypothetical protein
MKPAKGIAKCSRCAINAGGPPHRPLVTVDETLTGFALSAADFDGLCQKQPDIAIKLLAALGHELSVRIRYANLTIQQLETWHSFNPW